MVFTIFNFRDRARLIRDNDNERLLNMLFTSLRDYDDFGSAIESNPILKERIAGFAVYGSDLLPLYQWGKTPAVFDEGSLDKKIPGNRNGRYTIIDPKSHSIKFILHTEREPPMSPSIQKPWEKKPGDNQAGQRFAMGQGGPWFFNFLFSGKYYYIDITHPAYWRTRSSTAILGSLFIAAFLVLIIYMRHLYIRNREYRDRIESQKNLVVLGTAASTLAHEIKNPLSSIRLQTGILEKLCPGNGKEEVAIINEEVDRLSALTYRVNDYLREAKGNPVPLNIAELVAETGRRLCGKDLASPASDKTAMILADPERLRSVFENLIRNALESGGPRDMVETLVVHVGNTVTVTVSDRGIGIAGEDLGRIFDPFFTRKSTGTGIGLSISKRFTEAAGGSIALENREGGGAEAKAVFPAFVESLNE
ncbi:signal transduction histidine kinase, nitrogen specific, NtrB [Leadbettera azotonutricia ZAS-9]|uniref:histidine kinase n=1 Tax=Leadbettera azotonutricia (strain ATCC BAA-888 / DSM 13862 / ZAS-9) TaxID=545695 RepID=F5YD30_LEAAZ|nr:signal transduction histidine kinase, nitrogen specific, NtrB [Leadbettera azotonutricia ZAS-9]